MKKLLLFLILTTSTSAFALSLESGKYRGVNEKTGKKCELQIEDNGDYLYSNRAEYRLSIHTKGPFIDCADYETGIESKGCASGEQTNGKEDKSIYLLLSSKNYIEKIYFQSDSNDEINKVCLNLKKIK